MNKFKTFLKEKKSTLVESILVSIILPFIIFISIPLEIYKNNMYEFNFALSDFYPLCLLFGVLAMLTIFVVINLIPGKARKIIIYIIFSVEVLFFVQGTYLNGGLNSLNGDNLAGSKLSILSSVINLVVWLLIIACFVVLACLKDKKGLIRTISLILMVVVLSTQVVSTLINAVSDKDIYLSKQERDETTGLVIKDLTNKNLTEISETGNILYFVVDRFDERFANMAYENNNAVFDNLDGFTWFQDYIALYAHTYPAISSMLTLNELNAGDRRENYLKTAYEDNMPLKVLSDNGYKVNLFTQSYYGYYSGNHLPEYVANLEEGEFVVDKLGVVTNMLIMSAYRCFPFLAKSFIGMMSSQTVNDECHFVASGEYSAYNSRNNAVEQYLQQVKFSTTSEKVFSFIHINGCHEIYSTDDISGIKEAVSSSFSIINKWIQALKDNGLYDSSTIIITGDHGFYSSGFKEKNEATQTAMFFKPAGRGTESLQVSNAQVSQRNIWKTIFDSENIDSGLKLERSMFDIGENEIVERVHVHNTWQIEKLTTFEYKIKGKGDDFANWELVKTSKFNHGIMQ